MTFRVVDGDRRIGNYDVLEITDLAGMDTSNSELALTADQSQLMQNIELDGRSFKKRTGSADYGTAQTGNNVTGLGFLETDSGITPLFMTNQTLYKHNGSDWTASDKTNYTANLMTDIEVFSAKSGTVVTSGTTTGGSTIYTLEDAGQAWTPGAYRGKCVSIEGEIKYITDNSATLLYLGDKLNKDTDASYQSKAYSIYDTSPHAIVCNGTDAVQKYDGTTTSAISNIPIYKRVVSHQGRLWGIEGSGNNNDRIYLSDVGIADNNTIDTNININMQISNDGDEITDIGVIPYSKGSSLIVGKHNSAHLIDGDTILNYTSRPVLTEDGNVAPKSLSTAHETAFFLGKKGVHAVSGGQIAALQDPLPISLDIQPDIDDATLALKEDACGIVYDNKYWLYINSEVFIYDIERSLRQNRHVWYKHVYPYNFNVFREINGALYAGDDSSGQVYLLDTGTQDGSSNIRMKYQSGEISLPGRPHLWAERIEIMADQQASTTLSFRYAIDGGSWSTLQYQTLSSANRRYVFDIQKRCYSLKFELQEAGNNAITKYILPIRLVYSRADPGSDPTKA